MSGKFTAHTWSRCMDTVSLAKRRYTTKAYDASRRIPQATVDGVEVKQHRANADALQR